MMPAADTSAVVDTNPLISIWLQPRATIRHVVSTNPERHLWVLLVVGAFFNTLDRASGRNFGDRMPMWIILAVAIVLAPIAVPLSSLGAMVGEWAGGKLGGVATREQVRSAIAWTGVPAIAFGLALWPIQLALFGEEMFRLETPLMDDANPFLLLAFAIGELTSIGWSLVVGLKVFAEVHQFSAGRAAGSWLLAFLAILLPALLVVLILAVLVLGLPF